MAFYRSDVQELLSNSAEEEEKGGKSQPAIICNEVRQMAALTNTQPKRLLWPRPPAAGVTLVTVRLICQSEAATWK